MKPLQLFALMLLLALAFLLPPMAQAQVTCTAINSGWNNVGSWDCGHIPTINDNVIVPAPLNMVINNTPANAATIVIQNGATVNFGVNSSAASLTVASSFTVETGGTFTPSDGLNGGSRTLNVGGNIINNGTFPCQGGVSGNSIVNLTLNGTSAQTISGSQPICVNNLTVNNGATVEFPLGATLPAVNGTVTNNGTLRQVKTVNNDDVEFLRILDNATTSTKYRGVEVDTINNLGTVTASVRAIDISSESCTTDSNSPAYVERCYTISAQNPNNAATVTLWALDSERNGIVSSNLTPYHYDSGWQLLSNITRGSNGDYHYASGTTPSFSAFLLGGTSNPTAVSLQSFSANSANHWLAFSGLLILLGGSGLALLRRRQPRA